MQISSASAERIQEATVLEVKAEEVLKRLLQYDFPDRLKSVQDELILYDHLQPAFRGRWTGIGLLQCVSEEPVALGASII